MEQIQTSNQMLPEKLQEAKQKVEQMPDSEKKQHLLREIQRIEEESSIPNQSKSPQD